MMGTMTMMMDSALQATRMKVKRKRRKSREKKILLRSLFQNDGLSRSRSPHPGPRRTQGNAPSVESSVAATDELQDMLRRKAAAGDRSKPALHQVKLETFTGQRGAYKDWKRVLTAQRNLYQLQDKELSMLVYLSCKSDAGQILNQLEMDEMTAEGGLQRMLSLLEEA